MPASISRLSSAFSTSIDELDRMVKRTAGCLARNGVVSADTIASGRDRREPDMADEMALLQRAHFLPHRAAVTDDALGPVEHALALGREATIAGAAIHQQQ